MLDFNNSDYETTHFYNALEAFYNINESDNNIATPFSTCKAIDDSSAGEFSAFSAYNSFIYLMYTTVFIVSLIGNGLVCFVIFSSPHMKTVTNIFLSNLAIGDIIMAIFCVPFSFMPVLILKYWPFGVVMCKVVSFIQIVTQLVSAYTALAISIDRYIIVEWPLRPRMTKVTAKMVIAAVWLGACATSAPVFVVSQVYGTRCCERWEDELLFVVYNWTVLVLQYMLPVSVMVCTYARIAFVVWGRKPPGEAQSSRDLKLQQSKRKTIKMMVMVVSAFAICWLPFNIYYTLLGSYSEEELLFPYGWFACQWLAMSHSCYNPFIYYYMNNQYKRGFKRVFRWFFRMRQEYPSRQDTEISLRNSSIVSTVSKSMTSLDTVL